MRLVVVLLALTGVAIAKPARWETLPLPPAMPDAVTTGYVKVADGAEIYYATYGKGTPLILLHGGLGNGDHWAFQVPELAKHARVIVLDSRNQGRSTYSKTKLTYHVMAADVLAVMDELKLKRAAIAGWSDGGAIALDLGIHNPDRVTKLFVLGTNFDANGSKPRKAGESPTFNKYAVKCKADFMKLARDPKHYEAVVASLMPVWRTPTLFTKDQLRSITAPVVVADGDHDEILRMSQVEDMAKLIPNGKLVVFTDTSHFVMWQDPAGLTRALLDFLAWK